MKIVMAQPPAARIIVMASPMLAKTSLMACPFARDGQHSHHEQSQKCAEKTAENEPHGLSLLVVFITASRMLSWERRPNFCLSLPSTAIRATEDTALKFISYRVPQYELLRLHRRGALREPRAPSQYGRGALPFRDVQPRDALLLRYGGEWHANYVPLPFCGARLLFLTLVYSICSLI